MRRILVFLLGATLASPATAQVFFDDFDDGAAATRYSAPIVDSEFGTFDGSVDYAFDYGALGIPAAPGGGGTTGLRFFANMTDDTDSDEGESVGVIANDLVLPSGDFTLSVDVYYNVDPGSEDIATEYISLGVFTAEPNAPSDAGLNDDVPFRFGVSNGNGLAFQVTGDGGSATDLVRFEDPGNADTGTQANLGSLDDIPFGTIPGATTGGGNPNDPFEQFGLQNRWSTLSIVSTDGLIEFQINGVTANDATIFDNSGGVFSGGSILLWLNDVFNSAAGEGVFTIFDNVTVTPEPSSAVLCLLFALGAATKRRG